MECSMCGDLGFQMYLFQCKKCLMRFQHQYCSRAYYENASAERNSELCDWCYTIQEKAGRNVKIVKGMRSSCVGFGRCMDFNAKVNRKVKKCCSGNEKVPKKLKKKKSKFDRVKRKYKLLDEIQC